jgi:hypothetical protein
MFKKIVFPVLVVLAIVAGAEARTIGGIEMEESMSLDSKTLILNGAGIRSKLLMDMYVAGLYLHKKTSDYMKIIDQDEDMSIKIKITSNLITSDKFKEACEEGFLRTTNGNTAPYRAKIDLAYTAFSQKFSVGDVYDISYIKGKGTQFSKNGKLITRVDGLDFKKVLFGIWIIDNPSHKCEDLRQGMLGLK